MRGLRSWIKIFPSLLHLPNLLIPMIWKSSCTLKVKGSVLLPTSFVISKNTSLFSSKPLLVQALHWLPVQSRIDYKLATICHNLFSGSSPAWFSELTVYIPSRQLRSSADTQILRTRYVKTEAFGQRSYSYCAPKQWNSLSSNIRHIQSSHVFEKWVKGSPLQTIPPVTSDSAFFLLQEPEMFTWGCLLRVKMHIKVLKWDALFLSRMLSSRQGRG